MNQWYLHVPGHADRMGPFDDTAARQHAALYPQAQAWKAGMSGWTPVAQIAELGGAPLPPSLPGQPPAWV